MVASPPTPSTSESSSRSPQGSSPSCIPFPHVSHPFKIRSSWIASVSYRRVDGVGFLAIFTQRGDALLYGPSPAAPEGVPVWVADLVETGAPKRKGEKRSLGRAFNRLVRMRVRREGWGYQRVEGEERLSELKEMMK